MTMLLTILACLKVPLIYLVVSTNSMVTRCRSTFPLAGTISIPSLGYYPLLAMRIALALALAS